MPSSASAPYRGQLDEAARLGQNLFKQVLGAPPPARGRDGQRQPVPESGHQDPPLPDTDSPEALSSNIPSNIVLEFECTRS